MAQIQTRIVLAVTLLLVIFSSTALGAEYMVQIGAFKNATSEAKYSDAGTVGGVHHLLSSDAWQKVMIGKFNSRQAAETARTELIGLGYQGAFLVNYDRVEAKLNESNIASQPAVYSSTASKSDVSALMDLSADEQSMAVYLDGKLRIKRGDRFLTLEEFRLSQ